ncbi:ComEC/Rec2 family competence protein [Parapedobacter deserti]|uniref:ComEC/Rec2 family competence protein n=1 Tax=Parapedobacter deserti TaxID=1912957 RepID=A0ABV7JIM0_9SPHI
MASNTATNPFRLNHQGHTPFVRFLMALLAGIGTGYLLTPEQSWHTVAWCILIVAMIAFVAIAWYTRLQKYGYYSVLGFAVFFILYALGWISTWQPHPEINRAHFSNSQADALAGYVADEPVERGTRARFPFVVTKVYRQASFEAATGKLMLTVDIGDTALTQSFRYGDELILPSEYREVPPPYNPNEMNYRGYLANRNMWHQAYLRADQLQRLGKGKGNRLIAYALAERQRMVAKFSKYIADRDAFSVACTLILGYRADLSDTLMQAFSNTGTIHVLSVSGMHVVIVFWLLSKLFWWTDRSKRLRVAKFAVLLTGIWSYALLTGFSPSVLRASIMISFVLAAANFDRKNRIYNSIAASAFFLLLYNPKFIAAIGFQLSYLAVLGIVSLLPVLQQVFLVSNRFARPICDYAWMSIAAQVGAGPLAAYHFHQFPLYFLLANLLIVLPATGIMYLGFALLILPSGQLSAWTGKVLEQLISLTNNILLTIEQLPMANIGGLWMAWWQTLLVYLFILAVLLAWVMRSKRWVYGAFGCVAIWVCSSFLSITRHANSAKAIIFNIRHNLAIGLIQDRKVWLYTNLASADDPTIGYSVLPTLASHAAFDTINFIPYDGSYRDKVVYAREGILQFGEMRLMVYDGTTTYSGNLDVDVLLLRNNADVSLKAMSETVRCKMIVLDGSNHDTTINRFNEEAHAAGIPVYVLKNNFAYHLN